MQRFVFPLAVALCFLALVSHQSTVTAKDTRMSLRSQNYHLLGTANETETRKVELILEQFREVFTRLLPHMKYNTPVPTTVVVFKSRSSYEPFGPPATGGYFQAGPDVNYIALSTETYSGLDGVFQIIFHEYTHLLVSNTFKNPPLWFNEGLAEYYSMFSIDNDLKFRLGVAPRNHLILLRHQQMLPLRTLFDITYHSPQFNEKFKKSIVYAQSWALMHYLLVAKSSEERR